MVSFSWARAVVGSTLALLFMTTAELAPLYYLTMYALSLSDGTAILSFHI